MVLPPSAQAAIQEAARDVTRRALIAEQAPDTEAARQALIAVRDACVRAADLINTAERETREAVLYRSHAA